MKIASQLRPLAFEPMEQRLALSGAPVSDYLLSFDGDWSGLTVQGGSIAFDQVFTGGFSSGFGSTRGQYFGNAQGDGFIDIREGDLVFTGPVFSRPDSEAPAESSEAGSLVTPIPQPQIGDGEAGAGIIAVAEIFRPAKSALPTMASPLVDEPAVETSVARTGDDSWKSLSLARARDVYFEVAALTDDQEATEQATGIASKIAPLIYQQSLLRRQAERAASTTSEERTRDPHPLPPPIAVPRQQTPPAEVGRPEAPQDDAAVEKSQRTAQEGELPQVDDFSQVADPRDQVFSIWNDDGDALSEEAIALRTETQQGHSPTWPILAALAATGWMTRTRRTKGVLPSHRQPLRRKNSAAGC